jgi:hypothetical protein
LDADSGGPKMIRHDFRTDPQEQSLEPEDDGLDENDNLDEDFDDDSEDEEYYGDFDES